MTPSPLVQMADGRQPEDSGPQWSSPGAQGSSSPGGHGENGFSSTYRTCQPGDAHAGSASSYTKENGFNGDLTSGHAVTAGENQCISHELLCTGISGTCTTDEINQC